MASASLPSPSSGDASATAAPPAAPEERRLRRLGSGFLALLLLTYGLIVLGALVRAHGAGLACPDWPLCFGQVVPRFDLRIAFEWGHRAVAGSVALGYLGLAIAVLRNPAARARCGGVVLACGALLALQILLGALTVWKLLAFWTVTSHLLVGNAVAVALLLAVLRLRDWRGPASAPGGILRGGLLAAGALLVVQIALGGLVSSTYSGLTCPDWPTCIDGVFWPEFVGGRAYHLSHRAGAYTLLAILLVCMAVAPRGWRAAVLVCSGLTAAQAAVGVANVLLRLPVEITGLHSALATGLLLATATCCHWAWIGRVSGAAAPAARAPAARPGY